MEEIIMTSISKTELCGMMKEAASEALKETLKKEPQARYLTIKQVCAMLQISKPTLIEYRNKGLIKSVSLPDGKTGIRFLETDIITLMEQGTKLKYQRL